MLKNVEWQREWVRVRIEEIQILIDVAPYTTLGIEPRTYSRACMGKLVTILLSASVG